MWLYRTHSGNPRQMRRRRPLSPNNRTRSRRCYGSILSSWASTAPYRDQPDQFPPHKTLAALPPEGIVIVVWLSRHPGSRSRLPRQQAPFKIAHTPGSFEGVPSSRATYGSGADVKGRFDVTLWVFFGRTEPTTEQLDRAQAEVDRLQLPNQ
jgi:hypothetical protein